MKKNNYGIAIKWYRRERWLQKHHLGFLAKIVFRMMQIFLGCTIPPTAEIGPMCTIAHFHGIVIHHEAVIGEGTCIYQNVTLGGRNGKPGPTIGRNCVIGAGACVLGDIRIGDNVKIGANAVVLNDVPDNCTVVGVPAKIVKGKNEWQQ